MIACWRSFGIANVLCNLPRAQSPLFLDAGDVDVAVSGVTAGGVETDIAEVAHEVELIAGFYACLGSYEGVNDRVLIERKEKKLAEV